MAKIKMLQEKEFSNNSVWKKGSTHQVTSYKAEQMEKKGEAKIIEESKKKSKK